MAVWFIWVCNTWMQELHCVPDCEGVRDGPPRVMGGFDSACDGACKSLQQPLTMGGNREGQALPPQCADGDHNLQGSGEAAAPSEGQTGFRSRIKSWLGRHAAVLVTVTGLVLIGGGLAAAVVHRSRRRGSRQAGDQSRWACGRGVHGSVAPQHALHHPACCWRWPAPC